MTKRTISKIQALDAAAEKAGGYVMHPSQIKSNKEGERAFTVLRQYSLEHKIPISKLSDSDYEKLGIQPRD